MIGMMEEQNNTQNIITEQPENVSPEVTPLEAHVNRVKEEWIITINDMNKKFVSMTDLRELTGYLYSQRQIALEYHNRLLNKIAALNRTYRVKSAEKYNYYRMDARLAYKSDAAINIQIASDLSELKYKIEVMTGFADYIEGTIKTLDDMIRAVPNRIKLEELILGVR